MKRKVSSSPWLVSLLVGSICLVGCGLLVLRALKDLPSIDALKDYQPPQSTLVFDRNGEIVERFFDERRTVISLEQIPEHVKLAFIAAEDGDFFEHSGIDYFALLRAIVLEIKYRTIGGARVGGSTITQQTARTMLLSSKQTYGRKLQEMVLAQRIERALSKEQILHLYLNQIYFGNGAYGIEEASQTYFAKSVQYLSLFEAAALASIPKSPARINPFGDAERLRVRQHYVLDQMVKRKFIVKNEADAAKLAPLFADVVDPSTRLFAPYFLQAVKADLLAKVGEEKIRQGGLKVFSTLDNAMQRAAEIALKDGLRKIDRRYGYRGPILRLEKDLSDKLDAYLNAYKKRAFVADNINKVWDLHKLNATVVKAGQDALIDKIRLTKVVEGKIFGARVQSIDDRGQKAVIDLGSGKAILGLADMAWAKISSRGKNTAQKVSDIVKIGDVISVKFLNTGKNLRVGLEQEPVIDGGLVALDVANGGVLALVGGYDYERSPFNRIMQARRQPGSGIKPLIYGLALDREIVTAASIITDTPKAFFDPGTNEYWRPRNHTRKYLGDITVRHCLRSSINTCTITLLERVGIDSFLNFAKDVELNTELTPYPRNLTIALGSAENYPITVANAMRVFPNLGIYSPYHLVSGLGVKDSERETINDFEKRSVLRPASAFIITQILRNVITQSDRIDHLPNVFSQLAGKTGTTNDVRSAWFFGYSPSVLALVYVGYDDNRSIGSREWGTTTAFPIWANFMNAIGTQDEPLAFIEPEHVDWRYVDQTTGHIKDVDAAMEFPPENLLLEAFIAGTAPASTNDAEGTVKIAPSFNDESAFSP